MRSGTAPRATCSLLVLRLCLLLRLNLDAALAGRLSVGAVCLLLDFRLWKGPCPEGPDSGHKGEVGSPRLEDYWSSGLEVDGSSYMKEDGDSGPRADGSYR